MEEAHNPSLESLSVLVGDWDMELSNGAFLPDPSDIVHAPMSFGWVQDGAFLLMRMGDKALNPASALWLIGRDPDTTGYTALYYDARQVSRVYQMSFAGGDWRMWREAPGFSQRYQGQVSADGRSVDGRWEKSTDGTTWEHDFDVKYKRVSKLQGV